MDIKSKNTLHKLNLSTPTEGALNNDVVLDEKLLENWVKQLPKHDLLEFSRLYLKSLTRFNSNKIEDKQRFRLLDVYRKPLNSLLLTLSRDELLNALPSSRQQLIVNLTQLMSELAMGYKGIVVRSYQKNVNLKLNPFVLLAVNRACEQLSFIALHAYKYYQSVPARVFYELHQLYLLTEYYGCTDLIPELDSQHYASASFKNSYTQLLLISICNPYGLKSDEVINAYNLMEQLASDAEIQPLPDEKIHTGGCFFINCLSDRTPQPTTFPTIEGSSQSDATRIFNTKPILQLIDDLFQQSTIHNSAIDIALLKQLVPYLNTSYERKQKRMDQTESKDLQLAIGLTSIHSTIKNSKTILDKTATLSWKILNENSLGYLVSTSNKVIHSLSLNIGDLIGCFNLQKDNKLIINLASIRWLRTDDHGITKVGLKLISGTPVAIEYEIEKEEQFHRAILLTEINRSTQPATIIAEKNILESKSSFAIKAKKKYLQLPFVTEKCTEQGTDFDRFTFTDKIV